MADTPSETAGDVPVAAGFATPHITRLRLTNFRSHAAFDMACSDGAVIITGANGLGKTNILEAVSMLAAGRGLRSAALEDMQKDCLLYTSPSPRDLSTSRMPSSA